MLRLSMLTIVGLFISFLAFGRELSPDEKAELDSLRSQRTPIVTLMSDAFTDTSHRAPTYVATFAQVEPHKTPHHGTPSVQLASYTPKQNGSKTNIVSTTTVADPAKLAALMGSQTGDMILRAVSANRVNVRSGPSTSNPVLGQVVRADIVRVVSNPANDWVEIIIEGDGIQGFMSSRFLTPVAE
ncbi:MAG: hypothetical protein ACJAR9_000491 [Celeribacter sp.]|jgi:hypothetical protein